MLVVAPGMGKDETVSENEVWTVVAIALPFGLRRKERASS